MKTVSFFLNFVMIASFVAISFSCSKDDDEETKTSAYFHHSGHSYQIVRELKTWADASADAVAKGGYLVEIGDQAEQDAVYGGISKSGISSTYANVVDGGGIAYIWIGATDRVTEDSWLWNGKNGSGGTLFWKNAAAISGSFANWGGKASGKINEPDNYTVPQYAPNGQDAAAIGLANWPSGSTASNGLGRAGEWNDIAETNKIYYIIEFDTTKE